MRHITPSESLVMQEFERMASQKGWLVKEASASPELDAAVRIGINEVGSLFPTNVSLEHALPLKEDGDVRRALDVVRHAAVRHDLSKLGDGQAGKYHAAVSMLGNNDMEKVLSGLESLYSFLAPKIEKEAQRIEDAALTEAQAFYGVLTALIPSSKSKLPYPKASPFHPNTKIIAHFLQYALPMLITREFNRALREKGYSLRDISIARNQLRDGGREGDLQKLIAGMRGLTDMATGAPAKKKRRRRIRRDPLVKKVQQKLVQWTGNPQSVGRRGPDGFWGRLSSAAWNSMMAETGNNSLATTTAHRSPSRRMMQWMIKQMESGGFTATKKKKPSPTGKAVPGTPLSKLVPAPEPVATGPMPKERPAPTHLVKKRNLKYDGITAEADKPLSSRAAEVKEHIPTGLLTREMDFPTVDEMKPFKPKLPTWMMPEEHIPEHLVKKPEEPKAPKPSAYAQLTAAEQKAFRRRVRDLMERSKGLLSQEQAKNQALRELQMRKRHAAAVRELVSLANDLDAMGEEKAAQIVDRQMAIYRKAASKLYDVTGETGEGLINKAHPGGGVTIIPAAEEGGKVETIVEEQKKSIDKATKPPTGKLAFVAKRLVSLANRLDKAGKREASLLVDKALAEIQEASRRPFVEGSLSNRRQAQFGKDPLRDKEHELVKYLRRIVSYLSTLEGSVADQWGSHDTEQTRRDYGVWTPYPYKHVEYNEFMESALTIFKRHLRNASDIVRNKRSMRVLYQDLTGTSKHLNTIDKFYKRYGEAASGSFNTVIHSSFVRTATNLGELLTELGYTPAGEPKIKITWDKKPKPGKEPGKPSKPAVVGHELKRYRGTLRRIADAIKKAQTGTGRATLRKAFPGGMTQALKTLQWAEKELKSMRSEVDAEEYNYWLWHNPKSPWFLLKRQGLASSAKPPIVKEAQGAAPPGIPGGPAPRRRGRRRRGRRRRLPETPELRRLQEIMVQMGLPVAKSGKPDGLWGKLTRGSWNKLRRKILNFFRNHPKADIGAGPRGAPSTAMIRKATTVAQYLQRTEGAIGALMEIAEGVKIREGALRDVKTFLRALAATGAIKVKSTGLDDLVTEQNLSVGIKMLSAYLRQLADPRHPANLELGAGGVRRRQYMVSRLVRMMNQQYRAAKSGLPLGPLGDYRLHGRGRGYGKGDPFAGGLGDRVHPGGRGYGGGRGWGSTPSGRRAFAQRINMILVPLKMSLDSLRMFTQYANYSSGDRTARLARRKYKKQGELMVAIMYGKWMIKVLGKLAQELRNKNIPNKRALFGDISVTMDEIGGFVGELKVKRKDELNRFLKGK